MAAIARAVDEVANRELLIVQQQQLVAEFVRKGQRERARQARAKLLQLLYQFDLMQELSQPVRESASLDVLPSQ